MEILFSYKTGHQNCIFACHRCNDSFGECCFSCWDSHILCIAGPLLDLFGNRFFRKDLFTLCKESIYVTHFGSKFQSLVKTGILKIMRVSSSLLHHKNCFCLVRFRVESVFGPSWATAASRQTIGFGGLGRHLRPCTFLVLLFSFFSFFRIFVFLKLPSKLCPWCGGPNVHL